MNNVSRTGRLFPANGGDLQMLRLAPLAEARSGAPFQDAFPSRIFQLDASFEAAGTWAGVNRLIEDAWSGLLDNAGHDAVAEHAYELYMVLPRYRDRIQPSYLCLT